LAVSHSTWASVLRGLWFAAVRPRTTLDVVSWIWRHNWRTPRHCFKSVALVPRSLDILNAIRRARPDVVHLFWGHYPAIVGYLVRRHLSKVIVSMFLGAYDLRSRYGGSAALGRMADVVWTHAHVNAGLLLKLGIPRELARVVHRGIDVDAFSKSDREKIPYRLVTAGRLTEEKAVHDVLALLATTRLQWPAASLVVLGDGPERQRLVSLVNALGLQSAVTFHGHVPSEKVSDEMAAAQVFVHMSVIECLPNVVKEAMANGCACVVAETAGIEELVVDGVTGFVVRPGDIEETSRRLDQLFGDPHLVATMGAAGRDRVRAHFDARRSMGMYQTGWRELLEGRDRGATSGSARVPVAALASSAS
jgi:glycosyltransferase involved in cell wall biosynthesis